MSYERKIGLITTGEIRLNQVWWEKEFPYRKSIDLLFKAYFRRNKDKYFNGLFIGVVPYAHYQIGNNFKDMNAQKYSVKNKFNGIGGALGYQFRAYKRLTLELSGSILYGKNNSFNSNYNYTKESMNSWYFNSYLFMGYTF
ncbi:DUF3575 domain-containing protein [Flexithrix dorotheae]|uniref:DUF3575 domain-containing protein n=1 Tax=Flexithrix dorotheae TaxID=70993 RepID=UPI0003608998